MRLPILLFLSLFLLLPCPAPQAVPPARAALLVNLTTNKILYASNPTTPIPPASLTKIMTMFLTMDAIKSDRLSLNQKIAIPAAAAKIGGSAMHINPGEKVPVVRLLAGMAVASGNDAATALALYLGGGSQQKFVAQMNRKARQLGMTDTLFKNPTGLPAAGQKTTARDMLKLCRAYLRSHPRASRFHSMKFFMHKGAATRNTNPLLGRVQGVDGLKTGWTIASGYNLIVTAKRGKTRLLAIVLGCASKGARDNLAAKLLKAGFMNPDKPTAVRKMI